MSATVADACYSTMVRAQEEAGSSSLCVGGSNHSNSTPATMNNTNELKLDTKDLQATLDAVDGNTEHSYKESMHSRDDNDGNYLQCVLGMKAVNMGGGPPGLSSSGKLSNSNNDDSATDEDKSWQTMDSVHSRASTIATTQAILDSNDNYELTGGGGSDSFNFNDSCASFASFGASDPDLNYEEERKAFTNLNAERPTTNLLLQQKPSMRFNRAPSFRGSLQEIEETKESLLDL